MTVEKAYIVLVEPPKDLSTAPRLSALTAQASGGGNKGELNFMFNPEKYSVTKAAEWQPATSINAPSAAMPSFLGSKPASMKLTMLLDHSERDRPSVTRDVDVLLSAVVPLPSTLDWDRPTPPWAVFGWGTRIPMVAIVKSVSAEYQMFQPDGTPTRASCVVDMEEVPTNPAPRQNPTSGSDVQLRQHTIRAGDTLQSVARSAYGRAAAWRSLAAYNGIDDPWSVRPGDTVLIPANEDAIT